MKQWLKSLNVFKSREEKLKGKKEYFKRMCFVALEIGGKRIPLKIRFHKGIARCRMHDDELAHIHLNYTFFCDGQMEKATICIEENTLLKLSDWKLRQTAFHEVTHILYEDVENKAESEKRFYFGDHHSHKFQKIMDEIELRYGELQ